MLIAERHQKIIDLVNERQSIRVSELSQIFSKTEETIRRDLEKLESQEKLIRSHGGAISIDDSKNTEIPFLEREVTNVEEKRQIAFEAITQVNEGDRIILDASTTAWFMAKSLPDISITVVTNSIKVVMELSSKKQITVISTGGILRASSLSFIGPLAESSLDTYHFNKAFISCKGFHLERGMSETSEQQARIKETMIKRADEVFIMIDHSKFEVQEFTQLCNFDVIDYIITDRKTKDDIVNALTNRDLKVIRTS